MSSFLSLRFALLVLLYPLLVFPQSGHPDSVDVTRLKGFHHQVAVTFRSAFVMPTVSFFDGTDQQRLSIKRSWSGHLSYSFGFPDGSLGSRVFSDTYQGMGVAYFDVGNRLELGSQSLKTINHLIVNCLFTLFLVLYCGVSYIRVVNLANHFV